jgi:hypothetical protein
MSGLRLPLFSAADRAATPVSAVRQVLPGRAVIVGDTGDDDRALAWAARFVEELGASRVRVPVVLGSPSAAATDAARRFEQLAGASAVHTVAAPEQARQLPGLCADALWVLVGQPALIAGRGWLSVLLAADAPLLRWPAELRALRGSLALELPGAGLEIATALARALACAAPPARS